MLQRAARLALLRRWPRAQVIREALAEGMLVLEQIGEIPPPVPVSTPVPAVLLGPVLTTATEVHQAPDHKIEALQAAIHQMESRPSRTVTRRPQRRPATPPWDGPRDADGYPMPEDGA